MRQFYIPYYNIFLQLNNNYILQIKKDTNISLSLSEEILPNTENIPQLPNHINIAQPIDSSFYTNIMYDESAPLEYPGDTVMNQVMTKLMLIKEIPSKLCILIAV